MKYFLSSPDFNEKDYQALQVLFQTGQERYVNQPALTFEALLDAYYQQKSLVLQSGTACFQLLAHWYNFETVFCQNLTFIASVAPFVQKGATPVFLGSGVDWNVDPSFFEEVENIMNQTKGKAALIVTHLYGNPADAVRYWHTLKEKFGDRLILIEDAAEAVGSEINGKPVGTFGDYAVLSFNRNKIVSTSGGGALLMSQSHAYRYENGFYWATQAREPVLHYEHKNTGFNWRMGDINATLGASQWLQLTEKVIHRNGHFNQYFSALSTEFQFQPEPLDGKSNRWLTAVYHANWNEEKRNEMISFLKNQGIESRPIWKPMSSQPIFATARVYSSQLEMKLFGQGICLPSGSNLKGNDLEIIIEAIKKGILNLFL